MPRKSEQGHHFYASTAFGWGVGLTRDEAIRIALEEGSTAAKKGLYVWSARVELPKTAHYGIELYRPVGVPLSESQDGNYTLKGRKVVAVPVAEG
jgi:hypothetical protein